MHVLLVEGSRKGSFLAAAAGSRMPIFFLASSPSSMSRRVRRRWRRRRGGRPTVSTSLHLASVARCVLAQPVCASAAERNWSIYGQIKTKERSGMSHRTADKLVYCHEALHMKYKLQGAGYKQAAERWDSDSDSDETDEEDLKV